MAMGLIGKKRGMTRIFTADGESIPVTVIVVEPNIVTQVKSTELDGYRALQVATGTRRPGRVTKSLAGQYAKANVAPGRKVREFRLGEKEAADAAVATAFKVDLFKEGQLVDVTGVSMGKGYAGTIKRHHFTMGDATHGNSRAHRAPGWTGARHTGAGLAALPAAEAPRASGARSRSWCAGSTGAARTPRRPCT